MDAMKQYPTLGMIVRHGKVGGLVFVIAITALTFWFALPWGLLAASLTTVVVCFASGFIVFSYIEIVRLITDMLLPQ